MKKKMLFLLTGIVICLAILFGFYYNNKTFSLNKSNAKKNEKIDKQMAILLKRYGTDEYLNVDSDEVPKGSYVLNKEKSNCENGGSVVSYNTKTGAIALSIVGSDKCNLYFDEIATFSSICADEDDLYTCYNNKKDKFTDIDSVSGPYAGMYRYYGKDVNNYVSLDGMLFRIIGITDESKTNTDVALNRGQLKLIKPEIIDTTSWSNTFVDTILNNTSIIPSSWTNKITKQKFYDNDLDNSGYAPGYTAEIKLSLMYDDDLYYSVKDGVNYCYGSGTCANSWLNYGYNEWTGSRAGFDGICWYILSITANGSITDTEETSSLARRIVFYLKPSIKITGGTGEKDNPYILGDSNKTYDLIVQPVAPKIVSVVANYDSTITVKATDENGLSSYCVNQSSTDTSSCTWINNTNTTFTTSVIQTPGDYYVHVKDVDNLITHSSKITIVGETLYQRLLKNVPNGLNTTVNYGMYRFVGNITDDDTSNAGKLDNYICLGAYDKATCVSDPDKYMYRIIGLVKEDNTGTKHEEGEIKIIKYTKVGKYHKWSGGTMNNDGFINQNNYLDSSLWTGRVLIGTSPCNATTADNRCTITWSQSTLRYSSGTDYSLNGPSNSFLSSINFKDKIISVKWHNPKSTTYSVDTEYSSTNIGNTNYIGLLYENDYKQGGSWLNKSGYTLYNYGLYYNGSYHFKVGTTPSSVDDYYLWLKSDGKWDTYGHNYVKPVFYLNRYTTYKSGSGTYADPFIIN